jgi:serine/threonine protein kinase
MSSCNTPRNFMYGFYTAMVICEPYILCYNLLSICCRESYSKEADIWSLGIVLFIALGGYAPFDGANEREVSRCA